MKCDIASSLKCSSQRRLLTGLSFWRDLLVWFPFIKIQDAYSITAKYTEEDSCPTEVGKAGLQRMHDYFFNGILFAMTVVFD